jgi:hypothetical protein
MENQVSSTNQFASMQKHRRSLLIVAELVGRSILPQAQICQAGRRKLSGRKDKIQDRALFQDSRRPVQEFRLEGCESTDRDCRMPFHAMFPVVVRADWHTTNPHANMHCIISPSPFVPIANVANCSIQNHHSFSSTEMQLADQISVNVRRK